MPDTMTTFETGSEARWDIIDAVDLTFRSIGRATFALDERTGQEYVVLGHFADARWFDEPPAGSVLIAFRERTERGIERRYREAVRRDAGTIAAAELQADRLAASKAKGKAGATPVRVDALAGLAWMRKQADRWLSLGALPAVGRNPGVGALVKNPMTVHIDGRPARGGLADIVEGLREEGTHLAVTKSGALDVRFGKARIDHREVIRMAESAGLLSAFLAGKPKACAFCGGEASTVAFPSVPWDGCQPEGEA